MKASHLFVRKQRRAPMAPADDTLSVGQVRWLGALMLATQLPMLVFVPLWIAVLGISLVALRFVVIERAARHPERPPPIIRSWVLGVLAVVTGPRDSRAHGLFHRSAIQCVAFLFALIGIKYLETRRLRDGTLIVCLACLLIVTPFFYSQSLLAAAQRSRPVILLGSTLQTLARPPVLGTVQGGWRTPLAVTVKMFAQAIPLAVILFVLFPRVSGPLWGMPADHAGSTGLSDHMAPGNISELSLSDAVGVPRRLRRRGAAAVAALLARTGALRLRRARVDDARTSARGDRSRVPTGASIFYTVTLEPHWKPWLFALDMPGSLPQVTGGDPGTLRNDVDAMPDARPADHVAAAGDAARSATCSRRRCATYYPRARRRRGGRAPRTSAAAPRRSDQSANGRIRARDEEQAFGRRRPTSTRCSNGSTARRSSTR
jgi:hypothetical protein